MTTPTGSWKNAAAISMVSSVWMPWTLLGPKNNDGCIITNHDPAPAQYGKRAALAEPLSVCGNCTNGLLCRGDPCGRPCPGGTKGFHSSLAADGRPQGSPLRVWHSVYRRQRAAQVEPLFLFFGTKTNTSTAARPRSTGSTGSFFSGWGAVSGRTVFASTAAAAGSVSSCRYSVGT